MAAARRILGVLLLGACVALALPPIAQGQDVSATLNEGKPDLRIVGPYSTKALIYAVEHSLKQSKGLEVNGMVGLSNAEALASLAQGSCDLALRSAPLTGEERASYPDLELVAVPVGMEVVSLGVSTDVWESGVHSVTQENMRAIYEQKLTNWKTLGGPDEKITLFNFEQGDGIWEIFASWLYGDNRRAPFPKVQSVANSGDARADLEFTAGAIVPMGAAYVDGTRYHGLGISQSGGVAYPVAADVAASKYPAVRPIIAVVIGRPTLAIRAATEYLTSPAGQAVVRQSGAFGLEACPKPDDE